MHPVLPPDAAGSRAARPPCGSTQQDLWFAPDPEGLELAKVLCGRCPEQKACLQGALDRREVWGVWGGQLLQDGVVIARKRPRGRPRKTTDTRGHVGEDEHGSQPLRDCG